MVKKTILSLALLPAGLTLAGGQRRVRQQEPRQQEPRRVYFADGCHGGVCRHYDL